MTNEIFYKPVFNIGINVYKKLSCYKKSSNDKMLGEYLWKAPSLKKDKAR